MPAEALLIRHAGPRDAAMLAAFGARTFAEAFGADNTPEDLAAYLARAYNAPQQRAECMNGDIITLLAEKTHGEQVTLAAFAQVRRGSVAPPCVTTPSPVELWRFYVDRAWHGSGVATALMSAALAAARELGGRSIWLGVWERNPRAIAFYTKSGFRDVGSTVFVVGSDRQNDRVMAHEIADSPTI